MEQYPGDGAGNENGLNDGKINRMSDQTMFYGAKPAIFEKAKMLRKNMTKHEVILWGALKGNKLLGLRFKAQHPIDKFIADFYCHKVSLVVEIDGNNHLMKDQAEYDQGRTYEMESLGLSVIRLTNDEIDSDLKEVVRKLKKECESILNRSNNSLPLP